MIQLLIFIAFAIGFVFALLLKAFLDDKTDGTLFIYPDEKGRMCTVADFTVETVNRLKHDSSFKIIKMDVKHLDPVTRNNICSYNEESSTTVL